jgi:hypothetical protein
MIAATKPDLSDAESGEFEEHTVYRDIFAMESNGYGRTDKLYHCIDMREVWLICQPLGRVPLAKQADVCKMPEDM